MKLYTVAVYNLRICMILMKLYTVAVYNLRICMKDDNPSLNYIKGDNSWEIIICAGQGYVSFVLFD